MEVNEIRSAIESIMKSYGCEYKKYALQRFSLKSGVSKEVITEVLKTSRDNLSRKVREKLIRACQSHPQQPQ